MNITVLFYFTIASCGMTTWFIKRILYCTWLLAKSHVQQCREDTSFFSRRPGYKSFPKQILARVDSGLGLPVSVKYPKNSKQFQGQIQEVRGPDHPRNDDWTPPIIVLKCKDCQEDVMATRLISSSSKSALKVTYSNVGGQNNNFACGGLSSIYKGL